MVVNSPLIRPYFLGWWHWGVPLGSHEFRFSANEGYGDPLVVTTPKGRSIPILMNSINVIYTWQPLGPLLKAKLLVGYKLHVKYHDQRPCFFGGWGALGGDSRLDSHEVILLMENNKSTTWDVKKTYDKVGSPGY